MGKLKMFPVKFDSTYSSRGLPGTVGRVSIDIYASLTRKIFNFSITWKRQHSLSNLMFLSALYEITQVSYVWLRGKIPYMSWASSFAFTADFIIYFRWSPFVQI